MNNKEIRAEHFNEIANEILNKKALSINGNIYRICEIEMYLCSPDHNDEYVHRDTDQLKYETFYFHKYKTGVYKSGTYKGLDITLGNADKNIYFGILIRSIAELDSGEVIEGPCRCVNKILELYKCESVKDLTNSKSLNIFKNDKNFVLIDKVLETQKIKIGTRIGLSDKYPEYKGKLYRFVTDNYKVKKEAKLLKTLN